MSSFGQGGEGGGEGGEANKRRRVLMDSDDEEEDMAPPPPPLAPPLSPLPGDVEQLDAASDLEEVIEEEGVEEEPVTDEDPDGLDAGLSDEEGEDLMENMEADYVAIPELDTYDMGNLDHREYSAMDFDARRAAEAEIAERTEQRGRLDDILDRYGDEDEEARDRRRGMFDQRRQQQLELEGMELEDEELNLEAYDVPLREWIAEDRTRREVKRRFRTLLEGSKDGSNRLRYMDAIRHMCAANMASLEVHYEVLREEQPTLALWLMDAPEDILEVGREGESEGRETIERFWESRGILCSLPPSNHVRPSLPSLCARRSSTRSQTRWCSSTSDITRPCCGTKFTSASWAIRSSSLSASCASPT